MSITCIKELNKKTEMTVEGNNCIEITIGERVLRRRSVIFKDKLKKKIIFVDDMLLKFVFLVCWF